jgi:glycosyltransferase involved in cell wall biosynthesis
VKILHVIDSLKFGGAETLLLSIVRAHQRQGHALSVAYFTPGPLADDLQGLGAPLYRVSRRGIKDPLALPRLTRLIRQIKPDVVHTHLFKSDLTGQLAAALNRTPARVSTLHNINPWRQKRLYSAVMRRVVSPCHRMIAVSEEVRDYTLKWSRYPPEKMVVIENGVDLDRFDPASVTALDKTALWGIPLDAPTIGAIGRLQPIKGHTFLLQAAARVVQEAPQARFVLIGDGPLRAELEAERDRLGLQQHIVFAGLVRDIPGVLKALDIVALSSLWEGLPVALLEAMAMRKPVVATSVGGVPGVLTDGVNGLLVPAQNRDALAESMLRLLRDAPLATRLGEAARAAVEQRYSAEIMHRRILEVYESVLAQRLR